MDNATVGELRKLLEGLPDDTPLAEGGHSGNMLSPVTTLPEVFLVTEEFASKWPEYKWCEFPPNTTVLIISEQDG